MSVSMEQVRAELQARLEADGYFSDLPVVDYRSKNLLSEIDKLLSGASGKAGKRGAFVYLDGFDAPLYSDEPPLLFRHIGMNVVCVEIPLFNSASTGTGKSAWDIALRVCAIFHGYRADGVSETVLVDRSGIRRAEPPRNAVAYEVPVRIPAHIANESKCAKPVLTADGATPLAVTMTCATSGASIYWTDDESYPWSGNDAATLYDGPIALSEAATLRAVAHKSGLIASDSALGIYT